MVDWCGKCDFPVKHKNKHCNLYNEIAVQKYRKKYAVVVRSGQFCYYVRFTNLRFTIYGVHLMIGKISIKAHIVR